MKNKSSTSVTSTWGAQPEGRSLTDCISWRIQVHVKSLAAERQGQTMNVLSIEEKTRVIAHLLEGCSIRATVRLTGIAKKTVMKLQVEVGTACEAWMDAHMRNLPCKRLQFDEIWIYVYAKERHVEGTKQSHNPFAGDIWTWVAIDPESKLIPWFHVGKRTASDAFWFSQDVANRMANRVQITSDGLGVYPDALRSAFGSARADYAQLIKEYGKDPTQPAHRYSPPICTGVRRKTVFGCPDPEHISTSMVERSNLTMRMQMRRFTRLTNGFSKKYRNHRAAIALHFLHYNFARVHQTLRVTPAVMAGISDRIWSIEEIVALAE